MTVGFYHVGDDVRFAERMLASSKRVMPDVAVVQFTARGGKAVPGVDGVMERDDLPLALAVLRVSRLTK